MKRIKLIEPSVSVLVSVALICAGCAANQKATTANEAGQSGSVDSTAAQTKVDTDIGALSKALLAYKHDLGSFPMDDVGLTALVQSNDTVSWKGPYIQAVPRTPWGDNYHYEIKLLKFADDMSSSVSIHKAYVISVQNSHEKYFCVPKNQFEATVGFDSYLIYDPSRGLAIKSPSQSWSWWDLR